MFPGVQPETVHKIIIRAKRREILNRGKPTQAGKGNGIGENIPDPCSQTGFCISPVEKQGKEDEGAQDLRLMYSGTAFCRIKGSEIVAERVEIKGK